MIHNMKTFFAILLLLLAPAAGGAASPKAIPDFWAVRALQEIVQQQHSDMMSAQLAKLKLLYAPGVEAPRRVAEIRSDYLTRWARMRHITWTGITVTVRAPLIKVVSAHYVRFYALEREDYHYHYNDLPNVPLRFGIASRHYLAITKREGRWYFAADDWTNPVQPDDMAGQTVPERIGGTPPQPGPLSTGRRAALEYANKYCGDAPGCGNDMRYNPRYQDYNLNGGDCTNWISQVLHAGGFPMTPTWRYDWDTQEGTAAWSNAGNLAAFLQSSGHATEFARGTYQAMTEPTAEWPDGAIETLIPGDLISYKQKGRIVHTAVVVGYDPKGVVLTNTHTNDRYQVPWDFGWGDKTIFFLWHVHYPHQLPLVVRGTWFGFARSRPIVLDPAEHEWIPRHTVDGVLHQAFSGQEVLAAVPDGADIYARPKWLS